MSRFVSLMKAKFCIVFVWVMKLCRLDRYQCFSGVYCQRLKSEDGRSMFLRNFNPQDYNVNAENC